MSKLQILAFAFLASACSATVVGDEEVETDQQAPTSPPAQIVTANDLTSLSFGEALEVDLSRPGAVLRFEGLKGAIDLTRIHIILGSGPATTADDMVRVAGTMLGKELAGDRLSIHASAAAGKMYVPNPDCPSALPGPTDCCVCGIVGRPCGGLVCLDPQLQ